MGKVKAEDVERVIRAEVSDICYDDIRWRSTREIVERCVVAALARPTSPETGLREAERETQAVWRCAIGDVTSALDVLKNRWLASKRKAEREAGAVLSGVLDLVWAYRDPAAGTYQEANANGKKLAERVRAALAASPGVEGGK